MATDICRSERFSFCMLKKCKMSVVLQNEWLRCNQGSIQIVWVIEHSSPDCESRLNQCENRFPLKARSNQPNFRRQCESIAIHEALLTQKSLPN